MESGPDIIIRNEHGVVAGSISRGPAGVLDVDVCDEDSRWLVDLVAACAGVPSRPRRRASCSRSGIGSPGPGIVI